MLPRTSIILSPSLAVAVLLSGCLPRAGPAQADIQAAVAGTLTAQPPPAPSATVPASPTASPAPLAGLFCEYRFCIGHPPEVAFFDVNAGRDPAAPSDYGQGILAAYSPELFIELIWSQAGANPDPGSLLELVLEQGVDTRAASLDVRLVRELNVLYTQITSTATPRLPAGSAAAWTCGDRAFAWKAYAPEHARGEQLFEGALERFHCE